MSLTRAWLIPLGLALGLLCLGVVGVAAAPETPTPTAAPGSPAPTPPPPSPSATPTTTPTPTVTPTATPIPPTPTAARPTPAPSGYFASVYQGQIRAPGLETGLIRGKVVDFRGAGVANAPVSARTSGLSYNTAAGPDGSYAVGGLKPGVYGLTITGYPQAATEGIPVGPGAVVSIDFVEAVRPGPTPTGAAPVVEVAAASDPASLRGPSVVIVVLTPEGGGLGAPERPTPTPRAVQPGPEAGEPPWESWLQVFLIGMATAYGVAVLGLVVRNLRR